MTGLAALIRLRGPSCPPVVGETLGLIYDPVAEEREQ